MGKVTRLKNKLLPTYQEKYSGHRMGSMWLIFEEKMTKQEFSKAKKSGGYLLIFHGQEAVLKLGLYIAVTVNFHCFLQMIELKC
jgi:hypothetical protein